MLVVSTLRRTKLPLSLLTRTLSSSPPPPKSKTPLQSSFENWTTLLTPPLTPTSLSLALSSVSDPDLAIDLFTWSRSQRGFRHTSLTYLTAVQISVTHRRYAFAQTLVSEILSGACPHPSLSLYNTVIKFTTHYKPLFNLSFDVYNKMIRSDNNDSKPDLETYKLLFAALLRRFNKLHVCYVYLHSVRSLTKQMKASGVIPDLFVLNMIIKAFSKCLELDEAIRVFREMGLYGCEPNEFTYGYIIRGLCEKGRVSQGLGFYNEGKKKGFVVKSSAFNVLICSLSMNRRFEEAIGVVFDMLGNGFSPDLLSYKTLFEGMCRERRGEGALELLEDVRKKDTMMNGKIYSALLNGLRFYNREYPILLLM